MLVPPPPLLLLSLSSLSTIIAEENIAGGVLLSTDANLGAIPFDKEDVNNVDNNGVMVAAVIATPDTMGDKSRKGCNRPCIVLIDATYININITSHV